MHKTKHTAKGVRLGKAKGIRLGKAKDQTGLRHKARQGEAKASRTLQYPVTIRAIPT